MDFTAEPSDVAEPPEMFRVQEKTVFPDAEARIDSIDEQFGNGIVFSVGAYFHRRSLGWGFFGISVQVRSRERRSHSSEILERVIDSFRPRDTSYRTRRTAMDAKPGFQVRFTSIRVQTPEIAGLKKF